MPREAMIVKWFPKEQGGPAPVATIDLDKDGFTFESTDLALTRELNRIKTDGIAIHEYDGKMPDGLDVDRGRYIKITEKSAQLLQDELLELGYTWWEEEWKE